MPVAAASLTLLGTKTRIRATRSRRGPFKCFAFKHLTPLVKDVELVGLHWRPAVRQEVLGDKCLARGRGEPALVRAGSKGASLFGRQ